MADLFDHARFRETADELEARILELQRNGNYTDPEHLYFKQGWLSSEEWYKHHIWNATKRIRSDSGVSSYVDEVITCINLPMESGRRNNLIDWRDVPKIEQKLKQNRATAERMLKRIYCGANDAEAFRQAIAFFGPRYAWISFLFLLKDKEQYFPVHPIRMKERLAQFGIQTDCLDVCTWENYQNYCQDIAGSQRADCAEFYRKNRPAGCAFLCLERVGFAGTGKGGAQGRSAKP